MRTQREPHQVFVAGLLMLALALAVAPADAQTLHAEALVNGTEFIFVTQSLASATTVAWPGPDGAVRSITRGELNLLTDVEAELAAEELAPPVVVVGGAAQFDEIRSMVIRAVADRPVAAVETASSRFDEGSVDRRLGSPGADAMLRLEATLPPPADNRRTSVEVLWELLPELLSPELPGFRVRIEGDVGHLEGSFDPDLADLKLRQLRLALAQMGDNSRLDGDRIAAARRRLEVRRKALVSAHPEVAEASLDRWLGGGVRAVQEFLFGVEGITEASVREAARSWLPKHPGRAVLVLPPRVFNPRFAQGPEVVQLNNDLVAAVLERQGAGLSAVNLRPVLLPDVDGRVTAMVLTRVAAELRGSYAPPGWIRVLESPPALEIAAEPEGLPELVEILQVALERVAADDQPVVLDDTDARRRALQLMAGVLGLAEGVQLSPAALLQPSNLAVGVVTPDAETAVESLQKFNLGGMAGEAAAQRGSVQPNPRTRAAAAGGDSTLVVAVDLGLLASDVVSRVAGEVVLARLRALDIATDAEALRPVVPGRNMGLLVVSAPGPLADLEARLETNWQRLIREPGEEELLAAQRRVAASLAATASGPLGRARMCAAVAVGNTLWRKPADLELEILGMPHEKVELVFAEIAGWDELITTGAGVLPVPESPPTR